MNDALNGPIGIVLLLAVLAVVVILFMRDRASGPRGVWDRRTVGVTRVGKIDGKRTQSEPGSATAYLVTVSWPYDPDAESPGQYSHDFNAKQKFWRSFERGQLVPMLVVPDRPWNASINYKALKEGWPDQDSSSGDWVPSLYRDWRLFRYGVTDYGKVVGMSDSGSIHGLTIQWPYDLTSSELGGYTRSVKISRWAFRRFTVGDVVPLIVDPGDPLLARPDWKAIRAGWSPEAGWSPKPPSRSARKAGESQSDSAGWADPQPETREDSPDTSEQ